MNVFQLPPQWEPEMAKWCMERATKLEVRVHPDKEESWLLDALRTDFKTLVFGILKLCCCWS